MKKEITEMPELKIIGIECRTSNEPGKAEVDIPALWEEFYARDIASKIPHKISDDVYGLYCKYDGNHTKPYTLIIGCKVSALKDIPDGMVGHEVPASKFAVIPAHGEYPSALIESWQKIWNSDLKRTYTGDFELYGEGFSQNPPKVDVYIAVE